MKAVRQAEHATARAFDPPRALTALHNRVELLFREFCGSFAETGREVLSMGVYASVYTWRNNFGQTFIR